MLQVPVTIPVGGEVDVVFLLGQTTRIESVREILNSFSKAGELDKGLTNAQAWWGTRLGCLEVKTPNLSVDLLLNRWLVYQTLSCRFWGRSALYQSSGAFGFRDQLQDSRWRCSIPRPNWLAPTFFLRRRGNSPRVTFSTGGIQVPAPECGQDVRMT